MVTLSPGSHAAFIVDLGNYGRNSVPASAIFRELRKEQPSALNFTAYHYRRSGNLLLEIGSTMTSDEVNALISRSISHASGNRATKHQGAVVRSISNLRRLRDHALNTTGFDARNSNVRSNGKTLKVVAIFFELLSASEADLRQPPANLHKRIRILGSFHDDPTSLLALYDRPHYGGDIGYAARIVRRFYGRQGMSVLATARTMGVINDLLEGKGLRYE